MSDWKKDYYQIETDAIAALEEKGITVTTNEAKRGGKAFNDGTEEFGVRVCFTPHGEIVIDNEEPFSKVRQYSYSYTEGKEAKITKGIVRAVVKRLKDMKK